MSEEHKETEEERIARLIKGAQSHFENPEPVTEGEQVDIFSNFKDPEAYRREEAGAVELRLSIVTLGVADMQKAEAFYLGIFGWTRSEMSNEDITFIELNDVYLALYPREKLARDALLPAQGDGFRGYTLAHCTRTEAEVDMLFERFEAAGVTINKRPEKAFWGGYSGYISDPDGNLWEIAFNPLLECARSPRRLG